MKKLCEIDSKKDPAKKAFESISKCVQGIAMPIVMGMTDCGQWAGVLCVEGKPTIEKVVDDYMMQWPKKTCV